VSGEINPYNQLYTFHSNHSEWKEGAQHEK
jgi:hypothetical protein